MVKALVVAALQSGAGKTTVAVGLMAALRERGLRVQPYKVGPDYIDPAYHTLACGRPCRNLDRWLLDMPTLRALFARSAADADIAVIEGVMGLFDGRSGEGGRASTAEVANALGAPVVLVLDVAKQARTAAALVAGARAFDPALSIAGVVLNRVASDSHLASVREAIEREVGLPVLGALRRDDALALPERYLGLVPAAEGSDAAPFLTRAAEAVERGLDLGRLLHWTPDAPLAPPAVPDLFPEQPVAARARLAVARDRAFHFYYEDSLDLLRAWGAELLPFSPLDDATLPEGTQGVYLGGGFPELFAEALAENASLLAALREAADRGIPIYGECGGAMYIGRTLTDTGGRRHTMAGLTPLESSLARPKRTLGYRTITARRSTALLQAGERLPSHEFHWSVATDDPPGELAAYDVAGAAPRREGYAAGSVLASYMHLHFGSASTLAPRFVAACAAVQPWRPTKVRSVRRSASAALAAPQVPEEAPVAEASPPVPSLLQRYGLPGPEIERRSLAISDRALGDAGWTEGERALAGRLIYAVGDAGIVPLLRIHPAAIAAGVAALRRGALIVCDVKMVASGVSRRLADPLGCAVVTAIDDPAVAARASASGFPRAAEAMLHLGAQLNGAIVAIGNAPTALLALLDLLHAGAARPALIIGIPVGFVAATEAKDALLAAETPFITVAGPRGGTPLAVAAVNALLALAASQPAPGEA